LPRADRNQQESGKLLRVTGQVQMHEAKKLGGWARGGEPRAT